MSRRSSLPVTSPPQGLRERKQARLRETLIAQAMRLFAEKTYDVTTVDEIAEAAGISRRSLFRYFDSKGDIVLAWTRGMTGELRETLDRCPLDASSTLAMLSAFEAVFPKMAKTGKQAYEFVCLIEKTPALRPVSLQKYAEWEDSLASAMEVRLTGKGHDRVLAARIMARAGIAIFRTAIDEWIRLKGRPAFIPILRHMFELHATLHEQERAEVTPALNP